MAQRYMAGERTGHTLQTSALVNEAYLRMVDIRGVEWRRAKVVELRIFAGLNVEETAAALGVSTDTVSRDWKLAKAWLARELSGAASGRSAP